MNSVSIIVPIYNVATYIRICLDSIAVQTYKGNIECILVDDCSADNSIAIVEDFIGSYAGNVYFRIIRRKENGGLSAARNEGTQVASGDYIYYLDSDDYIVNGNKGNTIYEGNEILKELVPRFIGYAGNSLKQFGKSAFYETNEWASVWRFLFKSSVIKNNHIIFPKGVKCLKIDFLF